MLERMTTSWYVAHSHLAGTLVHVLTPGLVNTLPPSLSSPFVADTHRVYQLKHRVKITQLVYLAALPSAIVNDDLLVK